MDPVLELNDSPDGTEGLISQLVTEPPLEEGVLVVMSVPFSSVMFSVGYVIPDGITALTAIEMVVESEPPLFVAVTT